MNYAIVTTKDFDREVKFLAKKYRSIFDDLESFKEELLKNPTMGDLISENTRKVRMAIASKNKGKSSGARVITVNLLVDVESTKIYLIAIYDKSEQESITAKEVQTLKQINGLL